MLLQENLAWHELTGALRTFRVPSLVIFILDTTLRYIVILGQEASDLLTALKLRSVGHNPDKKAAMSGVSGILLQKSQAPVPRPVRSHVLPLLHWRLPAL
jgi:cobalt/nickel transport system permease protein